MKKFVLLLAVGLVAGAMYVAAAPAGQTAAGPTAAQFTALKAQVTKLQKQLKKTNSDVNFLGAVIGLCMLHQTVGVTERGDPSGTFGYEYNNGQGTTAPTTALDLSGSPTYMLLTLNPDPQLKCSNLVGGLRHFQGLPRLGGH